MWMKLKNKGTWHSQVKEEYGVLCVDTTTHSDNPASMVFNHVFSTSVKINHTEVFNKKMAVLTSEEYDSLEPCSEEETILIESYCMMEEMK